MLKIVQICRRMQYMMPLAIQSFISRMMHIGFLIALRPKISSTDILLITGEKRSSDLKLTTLIVGSVEFAHYFANLVYSENHKIQTLMRIAYCNIPSIIDQMKVDIIVVEADAMLSKFFSREGFLILPQIDFTVDISRSQEKIFATMSRLRRRTLNAIEKLGYSYETTRDPRKLKIFYHKMYLPYISKRHGKSAKLSNFFALYQVFRRGGVLLAKLDGKYVSGILYDIHGDKVNARLLGICEGKDQYLKEGAGEAALHFLIKLAKRQGYQEINYGQCEPFMNDGLFTYKKSWGMKVKPNKEIPIRGLRVRNFSTSVREFLAENPLVFIEPKGLSGLIFQNIRGTTDKTFPKPHHYYTLGLSRIVTVAYATKDSLSQPANSTSEKILIGKISRKRVTPHASMRWSKRAHVQDILGRIKVLMG